MERCSGICCRNCPVSGCEKPLTEVPTYLDGQVVPAEPLSNLGQAQVRFPVTRVRFGPSTEYAEFFELDERDEVDILARDPSSQWVLVQPQKDDKKTGWVAVADLELAPELLSQAPPVFTAWIRSQEPLYRGPGIFYDQIGETPIWHMFIVRGVNRKLNWVLVQALFDPLKGWVDIQSNVDVHAEIRDLPVILNPELPPDPKVIPGMEFQPGTAPGRLVLQTSSGGDIMTVNSDGSDLRYLTTGLDPVLSPDGQTVAYTVWDEGEAGNGSVRLIGIDGSNERVINNFVKQPKGPDWSPDGSQVVINYQNGGNLEEERVCVDFAKDPNAVIPLNAAIDTRRFDQYESHVEPAIREGFVPGQGPFAILCYTLPPDPFWSLRIINVADGSWNDVDGGTYAFRPTWDPGNPRRIVSDGGGGLENITLDTLNYDDSRRDSFLAGAQCG